MSSSDDDKPLKAKTPAIVASADRSKDDRNSKQGHTEPGVALTNGTNGVPHATNGVLKRKASTGKTYEQDSDSDDVPLKKRSRASEASTAGAARDTSKPPSKKRKEDSSDGDPDTPLITKSKAKELQKEKGRIEATAEKQGRSSLSNGVSKDKSKDKAKAKKATNGVKKEESDDDVPMKRKNKVKSESSTPVPKKGKAKVKDEPKDDVDDDEGEEEYKWWENEMKNDGTTKWDTLEHNGPVFAPPYQPLPRHVKLRYDGRPVTLDPEAEEVAGYYGAMLNSEVNVSKPAFNKNFFADFQEVLKRTGGAKGPDGDKVKIQKFELCDFKPIFEYYDSEREKKKAIPAAEKKANKAKVDQEMAPYQFCQWDGRKQKVGNFRVEPPGLFRGRGEHPKTGKVKTRIQPEQVIINIGEDAIVPRPPPGHQWKEVKHDHTGAWLAMWQENINGNYKYIQLAANSDIKGMSDHKKFEKARELKKHIERIRREYQKDLKSEVMADRQRATAMYLIDQFALRAGNEKSEDEADTVGCCSLKFEHITLEQPDKVIFDFLGKDSIRFHEEYKVDQQVFKNLRIFKKAPKTNGDEIFDRLTTTSLNKHLSSYMPGLSAKVFRTYNASATFARLLKELKPHGNVNEKMKDYNDANRKVAILCNHKRTVAASHSGQMEKLQDKIDGVRYQQYRTKLMMLDLEPKLKKKKGAEYFALPDGLDREWQKEHHKALVEQERDKITKKFNKDNEKRVADGEKEMKAKDLEERLKAADELKEKLATEYKEKKVEPDTKGASVEKLEEKVKKFQERIENMTIQGEDKKNTSDVALSTSKINYIDPRLSVVFAKKFDVPIEKIFSSTLRAKFQWAIESTSEDWEF